MKPLPQKNYGSIGHLPNSRLGSGDHSINQGQADILTKKTRDGKDLVIVQEKLDGANVGVYRDVNSVIALTRAGHRAIDSNLEQFKIFDRWVQERKDLFMDLLDPGERLVGEWIAMAHGTKYETQTPFIAFDLFSCSNERNPYTLFLQRVGFKLPIAKLLHIGGAATVNRIMKILDQKNDDGTYGFHGALEPVEGAVWRLERDNKVEFLAKFVRPGKEDGKYFNDDHRQLIWNWKDEQAVEA